MKKTLTKTTTTTALVIGLSVLLLFGLEFALYGNHTQTAYAEGKTQGQMGDNMGGGAVDLVSPLTEWIGIGAIGMTAGLVISPRTKSNNSIYSIRKTIFASIAVLSFSVGIIHILLIKEHMGESYMWGIGFLSMGTSQVICGTIIIFAKNFTSSVKAVLYDIGIAGNALFIGIFIYARLFVLPFSPDAAPVKELQTNGILTVIIQLLLVASLAYLVKANKVKEQTVTIATHNLYT